MDSNKPPLSPAKKFGLAGVGALAVALATLLLKPDRDERKEPVRNEPTVTAAPSVDTNTDTAPQLPPPVTDTNEPAIPDPGPDPDPGAVTTEVVTPTGRRRAVIPAGCTAEDVQKANEFANYDGYDYLRTRCDLISRWRTSSKDIVAFLADAGYASPAAECRQVVRAYYDLRTNWNSLIVVMGDQRAEIDVPVGGPDEPIEISFPCTDSVTRGVATAMLGVKRSQVIFGHKASVTAVTVHQPLFDITRLPARRKG